ncbi:MAG TPA: F0F1 ATP synthase subunit A, partial [Candidatus Saccharimonadales bacterium]|nr:F0F1 ATP synthase subunit A [Candidatus Saccharimonadales bacterium]
EITNSMFYGWICAVVIVIILYFAQRKLTIRSGKGLSQLVDVGAEFIVSTVANSLGSRTLAIRYAPLFATLFFFIMINNWFGLLPGVGHALQYNGTNLLRPFTADLNATLGMAVFGMAVVQIIAIRESGLGSYARHYFAGSLKNPITYLVAAFEVFTEFTRLITLGLRLFFNIAVGEILIGTFSFLAGYAGPIAALPFTLLEIFVGLLQAFIFVVLCISYLSLVISHDEPAKEVA